MDFGRVAAQNAKQVIVQKVREAERAKVVEAFQDRVGELVTGIVRRFERGNLIIDLGRAEAVLLACQVISTFNELTTTASTITANHSMRSPSVMARDRASTQR